MLGAKIKQLRQHHKLTLVELVRNAGVSKSTWHRAEKGEDVTISTLQAIAGALDVELQITLKERDQ